MSHSAIVPNTFRTSAYVRQLAKNTMAAKNLQEFFLTGKRCVLALKKPNTKTNSSKLFFYICMLSSKCIQTE